MTFYYFAYGSNMLTARLRARCPSAMHVGSALATNFALEFSKPSIDLSGKATLTPSGKMNHHTAGILFKIRKSELTKLDKAEGAGNGYERNDEFLVQRSRDGEMVQATTYLATLTHSHLKPYDWYLALVIAGAHLHGLGEAHTSRLRMIESDVDTKSHRKSRLDALKALAEHEFHDYRSLLGFRGHNT